jgi:hypothetical protein
MIISMYYQAVHKKNVYYQAMLKCISDTCIQNMRLFRLPLL